jgi:transglutaminase-like putative cysteine protease
MNAERKPDTGAASSAGIGVAVPETAAASSHAANAATDAAPTALIVHHSTTYDYSVPVENAQHLAVITPQSLAWQVVVCHDVTIEPRPSYQRTRVDSFGNHVMHFTLDVPHDSLRLTSSSEVVLTPRWTALDASRSMPWPQVVDALRFRAGGTYLPESEFRFASPNVSLDPELRAYGVQSFGAAEPVIAGAIDLMHRIHADFRYKPAATEVDTPALEAFNQRTGVCQDFAQVMIGCLRSLGLSARYVSGYLLTNPPPGKPRLIGADASHAWVSVFCPLTGWVDLDPTNDVLADTNHITLAIGRDYSDVSLLRGVIVGGGAHEVDVEVSVLPAHERHGGTASTAPAPVSPASADCTLPAGDDSEAA